MPVYQPSTEEPAPTAPLAAVEDLPSAWRPTQGSLEHGDAEVLLRRASAVLRSRVPRLDERLAAGEVDLELVKGGVTDMVVAVLRNPEGISSRSEGTGPFTETLRWEGQSSPAAGMQVPQWLLDVLRPPRSSSQAPGSITTAPATWGNRW